MRPRTVVTITLPEPGSTYAYAVDGTNRYETAKAVFQVFDHMYREGRHESEIRQELVSFVENLKPKQDTIH